jgi:xanthine dehydrogenase accessory factor
LFDAFTAGDGTRPGGWRAISIRLAPLDAYHVVMTYSHALDLAPCHAVLRRGQFGHLGLIGAATKRVRFLKRLAGLGVSPAMLQRLTCPMSLPGVRAQAPAMMASDGDLMEGQVLLTKARG